MKHRKPLLSLAGLLTAALFLTVFDRAAAAFQEPTQASAPAVNASPTAEISGIYVFWDWSNLSPQKYPIVGGHMVFPWAEIEVAEDQYDWSAVDAWLDAIARREKRSILAINTYEGQARGAASIPAHHIESTPQMTLTCPDGAIIPRYWDPSYHDAFADVVKAFGARYNNDPRVALVEISTGIFGETAPAEDRYDVCLEAAGLTSDKWIEVVNRTTDVYRAAFPDKQLLLQYAPRYLERRERRIFSDYAASRGVGLKHNGLNPDVGADAIITDPALDFYQAGQYDPIIKWGDQVPVSFEGSEIYVSMLGRTNTLWSVYNALDKHTDILLLDTKVTSASDRQDLLTFAGQYLGRTITDTPSIWMALRETEYDWFPDYGNFEFWLYQNDAVPGGKTTPLWNVGAAAEGRYTRRTDQASGNSSMYFDVDDNYAFGGNNRAVITVTYLDVGNDSWELRYDSATSDDRVGGTVQKYNTKTWKKATFDLEDVEFANGQPGGGTHPGSDFRIWSRGDGNETIHFVDVKVLPTAAKTLTLAPGTDDYAGLADTYLDKWLPDESNGNLSKLWVRYVDIMYGLLRFDLPALPANADILTATLSLYQYGSLPGNPLPMTLAAHRMLRPWDEHTANWTQAATGSSWTEPGASSGADREIVPAARTHLNQSVGWIQLDFTSLVRGWVADPGSNHGVLLRGTADRALQYSFYSGDVSDAARRPQLVIQYYEHAAPPPLPTRTATPTRTPTRTPTPSATPAPTGTATGTPDATVAPTRTATGTPSMTESATPTPTATGTPSPIATPTAVGQGRIGGRVWLDLDRDQYMDAGEPGIAGLIVQLARITTSEHARAAEELWQQAQSGIDGSYAFDELPVGNYSVSITGSNLEPTTPRRIIVALHEAGAVLEIGFGLVQPLRKWFLPWMEVAAHPGAR